MSSSSVSGSSSHSLFREWYDALKPRSTYDDAKSAIEEAKKRPTEANIQMAFFKALGRGFVFACKEDASNEIRYDWNPLSDQSKTIELFRRTMHDLNLEQPKLGLSNTLEKMFVDGKIPRFAGTSVPFSIL